MIKNRGNFPIFKRYDELIGHNNLQDKDILQKIDTRIRHVEITEEKAKNVITVIILSMFIS